MTTRAHKTDSRQIAGCLSTILLLLVTGLLCLAPAHANDTQNGTATGKLIVKYRQSDSAPGFITKSAGVFDRAKWRAKKRLIVSRQLSDSQELLTPYKGTGRSVNGQVPLPATLLTDNAADIEFVSPEYTRQALVFPDDPLFDGDPVSNQVDSVQGNQSYLYDGTYSAQAPGAWDITTGSESSVIAIVDTGVISSHPELIERSVPGLGFDFVSAGNQNDFTNANDGDGRDTDPSDPGDFCGSGPSSWHGTEVASVAGAQTNDAQGMAGIDWNARLLHARALGRCGGTDADIIDAVRWSAGIPVPGLPVNPTPAQVINLSIGGPTECTRAWQDVIDEVNNIGVNLVVAAGNEALNALRSSPANCANVITVASSDLHGGIGLIDMQNSLSPLDRTFSNYGLKVTVGAPGRNIVLATNEGFTDLDETGNGYITESGTSLSAAIVSGTVSLMHSLNPDLSSADVRAILQDSATPFAQAGECSTYYCGAGVLNMSRALAMTRDNSYNPDRNQERDIIEARAGQLPLNLETTDRLFGYRDIRYYRIDVPVDGTLTVTSSSEDNLYGYLLDADYGVLALDDDSAGAWQFRVANAVTAGTYYLAVERSRNRRQDGESNYSLFASLETDQPTPFTFTAIDDAPVNATITSNTIEITGLSSTALMIINGGFYSLNGAALTDEQATVSNGDEVTVAVLTAGVSQSRAAAELSVGAYTTTFSVTTSDAGVRIDRTIASSGGCTISAGGGDSVLLILLLMSLALLALRRRTTAAV